MKNKKGYGRNAKITTCLCGHQKIPYANGLCRKCYHSKWMNKWYERTRSQREKDHWRERNLRIKFKLSIADYDKLFTTQNGLCKICGRPPKNKRLAVDHDHQTNKIRGLLCGPCNTALSHVEHTSNFSKKGLKYLEDYSKTCQD